MHPLCFIVCVHDENGNIQTRVSDNLMIVISDAVFVIGAVALNPFKKIKKNLS